MRVFVASSSEQIGVAKKLAAALRSPGLEARVWDEETFDFSESYIESLESELERADFAVVIMTADDSADVRKKKVNLPRDNVIFELGLFIGRLGRQRCFFLVDGATKTQLPTDLSGVNAADFYPARSRKAGGRTFSEQVSRLKARLLSESARYKPSADARREQEALWRFSTRVAGHWWERIRKSEDDHSALSYVTMTVDEATNTPALRGWAYGLDGRFLAEWHSVVTGVAVKEFKIYYRWEGEHEEQHAQTYGGGGVIVFDDEQLEAGSGYYYDTNFAQAASGAHTRVKHFGLYRCDPSDEPIMKTRSSLAVEKLTRRKIATLDGR